mmetsp:Transcript_34308/g.82962  ORF Transcript_34308/g.82962 Transcript_34308/m.82962 type:complete len:188 (+) Transcript_34308:2256-2819(+)
MPVYFSPQAENGCDERQSPNGGFILLPNYELSRLIVIFLLCSTTPQDEIWKYLRFEEWPQCRGLPFLSPFPFLCVPLCCWRFIGLLDGHYAVGVSTGFLTADLDVAFFLGRSSSHADVHHMVPLHNIIRHFLRTCFSPSINFMGFNLHTHERRDAPHGERAGEPPFGAGATAASTAHHNRPGLCNVR